MWQYRSSVSYSRDELSHFGIKGQKWGTRRFQNEDGSLTVEGRERYGTGGGKTGSLSYLPIKTAVASYAYRRTKYELRKRNAKKEVEKAELNKEKERVSKDDIDWMAKNYNKKQRSQIIQRMKDHPKMSFSKAEEPVHKEATKKALQNVAVFMAASIALPAAVALAYNHREGISNNLHKADNAIKRNKVAQSFMKSMKHMKIKDSIVLRSDEYQIDKRHGLPSGRG